MSNSILRSKLATFLADVAMKAGHLFVGDFAAMMQRVVEIDWGTYTGTGVALDVATDGNPFVVVVSDTTQDTMGIHIKGMTDAHFFKVKTAAVGHTAANGITLGTNKFTIGTDADINTGADTGFWFALIMS